MKIALAGKRAVMLGDGGSIGAAIAAALSAKGARMTGHLLMVDGGWTAGDMRRARVRPEAA